MMKPEHTAEALGVGSVLAALIEFLSQPSIRQAVNTVVISLLAMVARWAWSKYSIRKADDPDATARIQGIRPPPPKGRDGFVAFRMMVATCVLTLAACAAQSPHVVNATREAIDYLCASWGSARGVFFDGGTGE